jgi:hypothetical protein
MARVAARWTRMTQLTPPEGTVDEEVGRGVPYKEQVAEAGQAVEPDGGHQVLPAPVQNPGHGLLAGCSGRLEYSLFTDLRNIIY